MTKAERFFVAWVGLSVFFWLGSLAIALAEGVFWFVGLAVIELGLALLAGAAAVQLVEARRRGAEPASFRYPPERAGAIAENRRRTLRQLPAVRKARKHPKQRLP
jgi:hypothetical protein